MKKIIIFGFSMLMLASCSNDGLEQDASGTFEATEILVSSEVDGRIMEFNVEEGDRVEAGAMLGYVDSTQLYLKKKQLMAGLRSVDVRKPDIRKQIAVIEQQIATANTERQRQENLVKAKAGNQKNLDDINNHLKYLQRELDAQKSSLNKVSSGADADGEGIEYEIMQLDDKLLKCRITTPQAGTVLVKYAEAGEITNVGKPLYKIADVDLLYLRAYVTASQLSQVKLGQEVTVFADYGDEQKEYKGSVTWISAKSEFTPKGIQTKDERENLVYAIKIGVKNDGYLKIGQYGEVRF